MQATPTQALLHEPQWLVSDVTSVHTFAAVHAVRFPAHVKVQLAPVHVSVPLAGGAGQGVQDVVPQELSDVLSAHIEPHLWKFVLHVKSQAPMAVQTSALLAGAAGHAMHDVVPQELSDVLSAHVDPHLWKFVLHVKSHMLFVQVGCPLVTAGQALPHVMQFCGSVAVFTHEAPHSVGVPLGQPVPHE